MFISDWDYLSLTRVAFTHPYCVTVGNFYSKVEKRKIVNKVRERGNPWRRLHHRNLKEMSDVNIRSAAIKFPVSRDLYWRCQTTRERINIRVANVVRLVRTLVLIKKYKSHLAGARRGSTWGNQPIADDPRRPTGYIAHPYGAGRADVGDDGSYITTVIFEAATRETSLIKITIFLSPLPFRRAFSSNSEHMFKRK